MESVLLCPFFNTLPHLLLSSLLLWVCEQPIGMLGLFSVVRRLGPGCFGVNHFILTCMTHRGLWGIWWGDFTGHLLPAPVSHGPFDLFSIPRTALWYFSPGVWCFERNASAWGLQASQWTVADPHLPPPTYSLSALFDFCHSRWVTFPCHSPLVWNGVESFQRDSNAWVYTQATQWAAKGPGLSIIFCLRQTTTSPLLSSHNVRLKTAHLAWIPLLLG